MVCLPSGCSLLAVSVQKTCVSTHYILSLVFRIPLDPLVVTNRAESLFASLLVYPQPGINVNTTLKEASK